MLTGATSVLGGLDVLHSRGENGLSCDVFSLEELFLFRANGRSLGEDFKLLVHINDLKCIGSVKVR